ncbi:MAG: Esterase [Parcubacteria group bacterium GW2011_GWA2_51_12]|nr:MAG: Esterase [Parcubacteria group bacterium GW2011_GWA2_51_12]
MNEVNKSPALPKVGIALSGASGRAIAHIGVLEVLHENGIPIDYITACSSGTIVASSYAAGTLPELKKAFLTMDRGAIWKLAIFNNEGGGVFSFEKFEDFIRQFTLGKSFEEVKPLMSFVACDLETGEPVSMSLGDLAKACCVSCTLPGFFPPAMWGNRSLVDGGFYALVPVKQARELGAGIVIGVDIAATKYVLKKRYVRAWRVFRLFARDNWISHFIFYVYQKLTSVYKNSVKEVFYSQADLLAEEALEKNPNLFSVLGKSLDIASRMHANPLDHIPACDIMLSPRVKHFGKMDTENAGLIYEEGRRVALEALPEIRKLIKNTQWTQESQEKNNHNV